QPVGLSLQGAIAELSARRGARALRLPARKARGPWRGALLCDAAHAQEALDADVLCHLGPPDLANGPKRPTLTLPSGLKALVASGGEWAALQGNEAQSIEQVHLDQCPNLQRIIFEGHLQHLGIRNAAALEELVASGDAVCLDTCGDRRRVIPIDGNWRHLHLVNTAVEPSVARRAQRTTGHGRAVVPALVAHHRGSRDRGREKRLKVESYPALLDESESGDQAAAELFLRQAGLVERRHAALTLQGLSRLARAPACPVQIAEIWAARCRMRRHLLPKHSFASTLWRWDMPDDQRLEAQQADYQLAVLAHQHGVDVTGALAGEITTPDGLLDLLKQAEPNHHGLLAVRTVTATEQEQRRQLTDALLHRALEQPAWIRRPGRGSMSPQRQKALTAANCALQEILRRQSPSLANAFATGLGTHFYGHEALPLLEPLADRGHAPSKALAMQIGLSAEQDHPSRRRHTERSELRRQAMAVALAPATDDTLASQ
ncbi:hypothetical protein LRF89_12785, partial [Halorhodospira sp. 9621]|uniref:hypothetical protein n=1 Tax=Halorhodospira sp. 9621 TaxID=2899135 RepID=UPI001EE8D2FC